jgi:hypothetical protein
MTPCLKVGGYQISREACCLRRCENIKSYVNKKKRVPKIAKVAVGQPVYSVGHYCTLHGPVVDLAPSENEYQENFLGVKAAGACG